MQPSDLRKNNISRRKICHWKNLRRNLVYSLNFHEICHLLYSPIHNSQLLLCTALQNGTELSLAPSSVPVPPSLAYE